MLLFYVRSYAILLQLLKTSRNFIFHYFDKIIYSIWNQNNIFTLISDFIHYQTKSSGSNQPIYIIFEKWFEKLTYIYIHGIKKYFQHSLKIEKNSMKKDKRKQFETWENNFRIIES